jgi:hypothetical protein
MPTLATRKPTASARSLAQPHRRTARRDPVAIQASIYSSLFERPVDVATSDVSPDGMFLVSDLLLECGERVLVSFAAPGTSHVVIADAEVVRVNDQAGEAGMGLSFSRLRSIDDRILRSALDRRRAKTTMPMITDRAFRC